MRLSDGAWQLGAWLTGSRGATRLPLFCSPLFYLGLLPPVSFAGRFSNRFFIDICAADAGVSHPPLGAHHARAAGGEPRAQSAAQVRAGQKDHIRHCGMSSPSDALLGSRISAHADRALTPWFPVRLIRPRMRLFSKECRRRSLRRRCSTRQLRMCIAMVRSTPYRTYAMCNCVHKPLPFVPFPSHSDSSGLSLASPPAPLRLNSRELCRHTVPLLFLAGDFSVPLHVTPASVSVHSPPPPRSLSP